MTRIGSVPYLNALPLTYRLTHPYATYHPSVLASMMSAGDLDIAMLPVAALLDTDYRIVRGVAIGCDGPVASVKLLYKHDLRSIRRVGLDANSRTSNELARIILHERYHLSPEFIPDGTLSNYHRDASLDAQVLIGDDSLFNTEDHIDLGAEWKAFTGLPFVFAVWAARTGNDAADDLRVAKTAGTACYQEIAARCGERSNVVHRYFTENMRYDLDERAIEGMRAFARRMNRTFTQEFI